MSKEDVLVNFFKKYPSPPRSVNDHDEGYVKQYVELFLVCLSLDGYILAEKR